MRIVTPAARNYSITMERQPQPKDVATNDIGMSFIWCPDIYSKLGTNFKYAMNAANTGAQFMSCGLDGQVK